MYRARFQDYLKVISPPHILSHTVYQITSLEDLCKLRSTKLYFKTFTKPYQVSPYFLFI